MNLTLEHYRALIIYDFRSNLNEQECYERLVAAFGEDAAPNPSVIQNLYAELQQGYFIPTDESSETEAPPGAAQRPNTSKKKKDRD